MRVLPDLIWPTIRIGGCNLMSPISGWRAHKACIRALLSNAAVIWPCAITRPRLLSDASLSKADAKMFSRSRQQPSCRFPVLLALQAATISSSGSSVGRSSHPFDQAVSSNLLAVLRLCAGPALSRAGRLGAAVCWGMVAIAVERPTWQMVPWGLTERPPDRCPLTAVLFNDSAQSIDRPFQSPVSGWRRCRRSHGPSRRPWSSQACHDLC